MRNADLVGDLHLRFVFEKPQINNLSFTLAECFKRIGERGNMKAYITARVHDGEIQIAPLKRDDIACYQNGEKSLLDVAVEKFAGKPMQTHRLTPDSTHEEVMMAFYRFVGRQVEVFPENRGLPQDNLLPIYREHRIGQCSNAAFNIKTRKNSDESLEKRYVTLYIKGANDLFVKSSHLDVAHQDSIRLLDGIKQEVATTNGASVKAGEPEQERTVGRHM